MRNIIYKSLYDHQSMVKIWSKNMLERRDDMSRPAELVDKQDEIFKLGLLLLICSIGSIELIEDSFDIFYDYVQKQVEESSRNNDSKTCCLIHDSDVPWGIAGKSDHLQKHVVEDFEDKEELTPTE